MIPFDRAVSLAESENGGVKSENGARSVDGAVDSMKGSEGSENGGENGDVVVAELETKMVD